MSKLLFLVFLLSMAKRILQKLYLIRIIHIKALAESIQRIKLADGILPCKFRLRAVFIIRIIIPMSMMKWVILFLQTERKIQAQTFVIIQAMSMINTDSLSEKITSDLTKRICIITTITVILFTKQNFRIQLKT